MLSSRAVQLNTDAPYQFTKTPARGTRVRSENVVRTTMQTVKGKGNLLRTPFQVKTIQPQQLLKEVQGSSKPAFAIATRPSRPLTDKTPFANRTLTIYNTTAPQSQYAKLSELLESEGTPESGSIRASSTRRRSRVPTSTSKLYETPLNQGNCWSVSDEEDIGPAVNQENETEVITAVQDCDEIEYMAPNTLDIAYHPPFDFDMPDYNILGKQVMRSAYPYPYEEPPPPTFDFHFCDNDFLKWDTLALLPIEDEEPAQVKRTRPKPPSVIKPSKMPSTLVKPFVGSSSRPATSMSAKTSRTTSVNAKPIRSIVTRSADRPATTSAPDTVRPPTTKPISKTSRLDMASRSTKTTNCPPRPATSASIRMSTRAIGVARPVTAAATFKKSQPPKTTITRAELDTTRKPKLSTVLPRTTVPRLNAMPSGKVPLRQQKAVMPSISTTRSKTADKRDAEEALGVT